MNNSGSGDSSGTTYNGSAPKTISYNTIGALSNNSDSEQSAGVRNLYYNDGVKRISSDPRWNESGYDADLGTLHIYSTTAGGANYGRAGIALYNDSSYQYLTTKSNTTGLFVNNTQIVTNSGTWGISITGTAGSETLATVTGRGASTSTTLTLARVITTGLYGPSTSGNIPIWQYDSSNPGYGIVYNEGTPDTLRIDVSGQALAGTPDVLIGGDYMQINGNTVLHAGNYNSYAPTLTGGGASGTWGINITGNAATASSVAWSNISAGYRTNYDLGFRPADNTASYAGFRFATPGNDADAGYLLIRGGADSDIYTQDGITLVADKGWLTLAQRTTANKGVRIRAGVSSDVKISVTDSFSDFFNILSTRTGSNTVDNIRFYNQDGNYAYIRTTSSGNNNNPWYDGMLGSTMWYAWDNPGQARTAGVYTEHRFGNGRGALSEYVKVNRGRLYTHNSSDVATITLDGLTGKQSFSSSNGTIISNASVTDMIGYNSTYQTYISGTATTIYATGIYYDGSGYRTLLHSANYNTYAVARYQTTQTGPNPVKIWNGHLASFSTNSGGNTYTIIQTSVPQDQYQMGGFTIEFFNNYQSTNQKTQIDLGGYWNPEGNGGFIGFEYHTSNPFVTPSIQVARNSSTGNVAFIITNANQSYQIVAARDLWLGYNASADSAWGTGWTIYETSSISGFTNNDGVVARVAAGSDGTNASGTWGINITGNAATATTATTANSVAWANISGGVRTNYDLGLQAPSDGYAGFYWRGADGVDAGYFLIRGAADNDVYTQNGITLVGDRNWVTIASRTTTNKGVRIMSGQTSASRIVAHSSGQVVIGQSAETKFSVDSVALYVKGGASAWSVFERNGKRIYINGNYSDLDQFCQVSSEAASNMGLSLSAREVKQDIYLTTGGLVGIGTDDFSYTANDNTPLVGSTTNNKLFVSGSIQLLGNNDAIVFGRGTASFFKDEEIGFGWGGGWYMTDSTYLRVRNNKTIYTTGNYEGTNVFLKSNGSLELSVSNNASFCHADARPNGNYAALHLYTYNPSLGTYGAYREYWWDGDSYHSIYVSSNQFYFDSSVNATAFYETSDMRLKTLIEENYIPVGIENVKAKLYEKNGKKEVGYFAQDLEGVLDSALSINDEGYFNLSYREVHTAKIAALEKEVRELKEQLKRK
jgi:hypothetical protein